MRHMGRHSRGFAGGAKGGAGIAIFSAIAVVALVLVGLGVRALVVSDPSNAQDQASSQSDSSGESDDAGSGDGGSDEERERPDMGGGDSAQGSGAEQQSDQAKATADADTEQDVENEEAPEALAQCHARVAAGNEWAAVTATSASHWKQHYMASVRYNDGEISLEQAEAEFAESKAQGPADMRALSEAESQYSRLRGACADLVVDDMPEGWSQEAQQCLDRAEAIDEVVATGTEVNDDWSHHLEMMRTKADTDPEVYQQRWRAMVQAAPETMGPYEAAASDLEDAPSCSV